MSIAVQASAVIAYAGSSTAMIIMSKLVTTKYEVNHPVMLILLQMTAGSGLALAARQFGLAKFDLLNRSSIQLWLPTVLVFVMMLASSLISLHSMSLTMYHLIKNSALFLTALADTIFFDRPVGMDHKIAFVLMAVGTVLSGGQDRWITKAGLFWTTVNVVCTVSYNIMLKRLLNNNESFGGFWSVMFHCNSLSAIILLFPAVALSPNFVSDVFNVSSGTKSTAVIVYIILGAVLSLTSVCCMSVTSPTTYAVVGAASKLPNMVLGALIFQQFPTSRGVLGIIVAFHGIALYTHTSIRKNNRRLKLAEDSTGESKGDV
eukprot:TRINITY_DN1853_c1_g1_i1.p1 TRINITY_DN1853_c1_g1~~TRINITY_DN1853_c1_g1_i1.p1  ORF type:complete len:318 (+),score=36.94 TRINITY_DN1853_c1_g1_i1:64-1017(+)